MGITVAYRHRALIALAAVGVTLLAACSSSSGGSGNGSSPPASGPGSDSGTASSAGGSGAANPSGVLTPSQAGDQITQQLGPLPVLTTSTTRGVNGKVIKIGGVGTDTKAGQHTLPGLADGAKARFERANKEGGVNGYTFDYVGFTDDTGLPGPAQQGVQDLVESDKVFAVVPFTSASGNLGSYFSDNKVPYFGWLGQDYCGWADKEYGFSITGESSCASPLPGKTIGTTSGLQAFLQATGMKASDVKLAIYSSSDPYGKAGMDGIAAAATGLGMKVVYAVADLPSATEPPLTDFTPVATKLMNSGANVVYGSVTSPAMLGVTGSLKALGYTGKLVYGQGAAALLQNDGTAQTVDGMYGTVASGNAAFGADTIQQVTADMKAINSTWPADGIGTLTSYMDADLFLQAFAKISGDVTAEKLVNVLNQGGFTYQGIPGVTCSQSWPAGRVLSPACAGVVQYDAKSKSLVSKEPLKDVGGYVISSS